MVHIADPIEAHAVRAVALHGGHAILAIETTHGRVELVRTDDATRIALPVEAVMAFTFVGDQLWVATTGSIRAFGLDGAELDGPLAVSPEAARLVAGRTATTAIWSGHRAHLVISRAADGWHADPLHAPTFTGAMLIPTTDRRLLAVFADRVVICTEQGRVLVTCKAPARTRVVTAATILGGRATAMLLHGPGGAALAIHDWSGRRVRDVRLAGGATAIAFAEAADFAVVASAEQLVAIDLRLGITRATARAPFAIGALAISPTGSSLVVTGDADEILQLDASAWWSAPVTIVEVVDESVPEPDLACDDEPEHQTSLEAVPVEAPAVAPAVTEVAAPTFALPIASPRKRSAGWGGGSADAMGLALRHAGLLYERLVFAARDSGLVPPASSRDPLAGLAVEGEEIVAILASFAHAGERDAADPYVEAVDASRGRLRAGLTRAEAEGLGLALATRALALDDAALDALVIALAPDLDPRFGRVAGFLANDLSRMRPTLGLLAIAAQLGHTRIDLAPRLGAALSLDGLIEQVGDGSIAGREVRVPVHLVDALTTDLTAAYAPALAWTELAWSPRDRERLRTGVVRELARAQRLVVVGGAPGSGRCAIARAAATELGKPTIVIELEAGVTLDDTRRRAHLLAALVRAKIAGAVLAIRWRPTPRDPLWRLASTEARALEVPCVAIVGTGDIDSLDAEVAFVRFDAPAIDAEARHALWVRGLAAHGLTARSELVDDLATRYQLTPGRLLETVAELRARKLAHEPVTIEDVRDTLGSITSGRLANLARRHRAKIQLDDLAFPEVVSTRIAELVHRVELRRRVLSEWAFADKAHDGYGVSALFVGPPGTGKTAAAAAIANALNVDLYIVDLSRIMSKWVGETEQNLARVFDEAEASNAALLFDEADALFGKRSVEQRGGSDRYANLTINYLLQRMESYTGLAILTTNLMSAMDAAFQRRITTMVHFPPSDEDMRLALWRKLLPRGARFAPDVDLRSVARSHAMEAAHIRRALVRAAFRAASRGRPDPVLDANDLSWAAAAEYEDMGRIATRAPGPDHPAHQGDA